MQWLGHTDFYDWVSPNNTYILWIYPILYVLHIIWQYYITGNKGLYHYLFVRIVRVQTYPNSSIGHKSLFGYFHTLFFIIYTFFFKHIRDSHLSITLISRQIRLSTSMVRYPCLNLVLFPSLFILYSIIEWYNLMLHLLILVLY